MTPRVRVVQYVVQAQVVVDDGETLTPAQVQPLTISAAEWPTFAETGMAEYLAKLQSEFDKQQTDPA